ncbi:hypothetical protein ACFL6C_10860 [Myxococcota bacterium]
MPRLRDGATVTVWPRCVLVSHPDAGTVHLATDELPLLETLSCGGKVDSTTSLAEKLASHLTDEASSSEDPTRKARLVELDQRYAGWIPGLWQQAGGAIGLAETILARPRLLPWPRTARPTLPASIARRSMVINRWGPNRIYVEDDIDALAVLLAQHSEVTVLEPDRRRRTWLEQQAAFAGVSLAWVDAPIPNGQFDFTVIHAGSPRETRATLQRAVDLTRPGGHIAVCLRAPWEWTLYAQLEAAGLPVLHYEREIDHWLLPNNLVVDGAGDLVVVERTESVTLSQIDDAWAEQVRSQPYVTVDLDSLDEDEVVEGAAEKLVDAIAMRAPSSEETRSIQRQGDRDVICWYDERGVGLSAQLNHEEDHLMMTFMPFDRHLEYVAICAAYHLLADELTRTRPVRTRRWHQETVFG